MESSQRRRKLHQKLLDVSGIPCYFQTPENLKMEYPCIRYRKDTGKQHNADNLTYKFTTRYNIIYIHEDPDDELVYKLIDSFELIRWDTQYIAENLYHDTFTLYF